MKKKIVACLLVMGIALVGCGNNETPAATPTEAPVVEQTEEAVQTENADQTEAETPSEDVDVSETTDETTAEGTDFDYYSYCGGYQDSWSQRAFAEVALNEDGQSVHVYIQWGSSAIETNAWEMDCTYVDALVGPILAYENGAKYEITYDDDGTENINTVYTDAEGFFALDSPAGALNWYGAYDEECRECIFEKVQ